MKLIYDVQLDDILAFNSHHFRHSPVIRRKRRLVVITVTLVAFAGFLYKGWSNNSFRSGISWLIAYAVVLLLITLVPKYPNKRFVRQLYQEGSNRNTLGAHVLELADKGLVEQTEQSITNVTWKGIERIISTDEHTFIYISAITAHIIPRNSVIEGDYTLFVDTLIKRFRQITLPIFL